jgi:hypothetical protein
MMSYMVSAVSIPSQRVADVTLSPQRPCPEYRRRTFDGG